MCPIIGYNGTNIVPIIGQISRVDLYEKEAATMLTTDVAIYCHQVATELRLQFYSCHQVATIVPPAWMTSSLMATRGGRFVLHQNVLFKLLFKNASKYLHMSFFSHANNCPCECYH